MKYIERLNLILKEHTDVRIVELQGNTVLLSNGRSLSSESDVRKFKRRVSTNNISYLSRFNDLYSNDLALSAFTEKQIKQDLCRKGGIAVQQKYGDRIKKNLNTGVPWNKGTAGNYSHSPWSKGLTKDTNNTLKKISSDRSGAGNPMYGKSQSTHTKLLKSQIMKEKILKGEFTPNTNNRNTHWESLYKGKKYRSSWEALCQHLYPDAEYESLRINYRYKDTTLVYIIDFVDHNTKTVIEVKPREFQCGEKYKCKISALKEWCLLNGYEMKIFDQADIAEYNIATEEEKYFDANTIRKLREVRL
jgi:hypothetical protein